MFSVGYKFPNVLVSIIQTKDSKSFDAGVSLLKSLNFRWNPENKVWERNAFFNNENLEDELRMIDDVYFPKPIKDLILNYKNELKSEMIRGEPIEKIDYSKIIKAPYGPIKGKAPFENYQDEDLRRALAQNRFMFNWKMGLGKSFATAVIYEYLRVYKDMPKMILITSRIGTFNLQSEMAKFCLHISLEDVAVFNSPESFKKTGRNIFDSEEVNNKNILVFSYDSWKLMASSYGDKALSKKRNVPIDNFFQGKEKLLCLDECHYLSNPKSQRTKLLFKYLGAFKYRFLFSATPADKPEKLYSILIQLDPKLCGYMKYQDWISKYNEVGTFFSKYAINKKRWKDDELEELNKDLAFYSAKRESEDVLDLPPYFVKTFEVDMSQKQKELYKEFINEVVNKSLSEQIKIADATVDIIREAFSTVMSFTENPLILEDSQSESIPDKIKTKCGKFNFIKDYKKLEVVDSILEDEVDENEKRGIIWYIHPRTRDELLKKYKNYDPIVISAAMSEEERDNAIKKFKENKNHKILIASQYILATSVTLIECTFAIYLETAFSYEVYLQSTGRIYRIGQKDPVTIYHIWYKGTVDQFHIEAISKKQDLVNMLFSSKEAPVMKSLGQFKKLFSGEVELS